MSFKITKTANSKDGKIFKHRVEMMKRTNAGFDVTKNSNNRSLSKVCSAVEKSEKFVHLSTSQMFESKVNRTELLAHCILIANTTTELES